MQKAGCRLILAHALYGKLVHELLYYGHFSYASMKLDDNVVLTQRINIVQGDKIANKIRNSTFEMLVSYKTERSSIVLLGFTLVS